MLRKKALTFAVAAVMSVSAVTAMSASASAAWVKFSDGSYGYKSDSTGKQLTGWQTISGGKYYFDKNGKALTGWKKINGNTYYFNAAKKGKAITSWAKIGSNKYYFGSDGVMRTGWIKLNGKTYYFGSDGAMRTGKIKISNKVYDFGTDGVLKSTSTSGSSSKLTAPMNGLKWGMSADSVIDIKGDDNYILMSPMLMYTNSDPMPCYFFGDKTGLFAYGCTTSYSSAKVKEFRQYFTDDGWKYEMMSKDGDAQIYLYSKGNSVGAVEYNDTICMTMVFSDDMVNDVYSGKINDILDIE